MALRLVPGQGDGQDVVGGVAGGGQRPSPRRRLVHGAQVRLPLLKPGRLSRLQPYLGNALRNNHAGGGSQGITMLGEIAKE